MAVDGFTKKDIGAVLKAVPSILDLPQSQLWVDYDEDADVLYLAFARPQKATDSEMRDDGIIIHRRGKRVVGMTVLEASRR